MITAYCRIWPHLPTPARSHSAPRRRAPDCSLSSRPREPQQRYDHASPRPDPAPAGTDGSGGSQQLSRRIARGCQLVRYPASSPPDRLDHCLPAAPCRAARSASPNCAGTENQGGAAPRHRRAPPPGSASSRPARRGSATRRQPLVCHSLLRRSAPISFELRPIHSNCQFRVNSPHVGRFRAAWCHC